MVETSDLTSAIVGGLITAVGAPTVIWLVLKGKLSEWFVPREIYNMEKAQAKADLDNVGAKVTASVSLATTIRTDLDDTRDRVKVIEVKHDAVMEGVHSANDKLDTLLQSFQRSDKTAALLELRVERLEKGK